MKHLKRWVPFVTLALGVAIPVSTIVMMARHEFIMTAFFAKVLVVSTLAVGLYALSPSSEFTS